MEYSTDYLLKDEIEENGAAVEAMIDYSTKIRISSGLFWHKQSL